MERIPTGITKLDEKIGGGLSKGQSNPHHRLTKHRQVNLWPAFSLQIMLRRQKMPLDCNCVQYHIRRNIFYFPGSDRSIAVDRPAAGDGISIKKPA
jgi:hypothetical protein